MHVEHLDGVDSGLIAVVSLSWLEVEDGRSIRRPVGSVGVSFGGKSRGNVWGGGMALQGWVWFVGGLPFMVSNGRGEEVTTLGCGL